jgi:hypothetical protein
MQKTRTHRAAGINAAAFKLATGVVFLEDSEQLSWDQGQDQSHLCRGSSTVRLTRVT